MDQVVVYTMPKKIYEHSYKKILIDITNIINENKNLVLDMKNTIFISSSGIRVLIMALKTLRAKDKNLKIINTNQYIDQILEVTGLISWVTLNQEKDIEKIK